MSTGGRVNSWVVKIMREYQLFGGTVSVPGGQMQNQNLVGCAPYEGR